MKNMILVMKKELYRVFSDRKLIVSLFVVPAILMVALYSLLGVLVNSMNKDIEQHISVTYVVNATEDLKTCIKASGFSEGADIKYLTQADYNAKKADLEASVLDGDTDLVVVLDEDFEAVYAAYKGQGDAIPNINIMFNTAENYSQQAYSVFSGALDIYRTALIQGRLGNIEVLSVFNQTETPVAKEAKANTQFISMMLPYMIMIMLFSGAMSISVDAFAGEKERGTLAAMLISPIKRTDIAMGKVIALAIVAGISSIVYAVSMIVSMGFMGKNAGDGISGFGNVSFDAGQIVQIGLMLIILDYFFVAVIALLSSLAKDVKSASTFVTPAYMVVLVCALMTMFSTSSKTALSQYAIPLYGNALAIQDICTGELSTAGFLVSFGVTFVLAAAITFGLAKAFDSDKLMFNA